MVAVNLRDIERDILHCLEQVRAGESVLIVSDQTPIAQITPVEAPRREPRPIGLCRGDFVVPDDFDAPLPLDIIQSFEN